MLFTKKKVILYAIKMLFHYKFYVGWFALWLIYWHRNRRIKLKKDSAIILLKKRRLKVIKSMMCSSNFHFTPASEISERKQNDWIDCELFEEGAYETSKVINHRDYFKRIRPTISDIMWTVIINHAQWSEGAISMLNFEMEKQYCCKFSKKRSWNSKNSICFRVFWIYISNLEVKMHYIYSAVSFTSLSICFYRFFSFYALPFANL